MAGNVACAAKRLTASRSPIDLVSSELNPQNRHQSQAPLKYPFGPGRPFDRQRVHLFTLTQHSVAVKPRIYDAAVASFPEPLNPRCVA